MNKKVVLGLVILILVGLGVSSYFSSDLGQGFLKLKSVGPGGTLVKLPYMMDLPDDLYYYPAELGCLPEGQTDLVWFYDAYKANGSNGGYYSSYDEFYLGLKAEIEHNNGNTVCPYLVRLYEYSNSEASEVTVVCDQFTLSGNNIVCNEWLAPNVGVFVITFYGDTTYGQCSTALNVNRNSKIRVNGSTGVKHSDCRVEVLRAAEGYTL